MKKISLFLVTGILCILLVSGCVQEPGAPKNPVLDNPEPALNATAEWLGSGQGARHFPDGAAGEAYPVYTVNKELDHWLVTIKDSEGSYTGYLIYLKDSFQVPDTIASSSEHMDDFLSVSSSDAFSEMLEKNSEYNPGQFTRPIMVIRREGETGYFWMSEIEDDGEIIKEYVKITLSM